MAKELSVKNKLKNWVYTLMFLLAYLSKITARFNDNEVKISNFNFVRAEDSQK